MSSEEEESVYSGSEDESGSDSGSGSDDDEGSGSESGSGDDSESGSGSEQEDSEGEEEGDGIKEEERVKLMSLDIAQIVELSGQMDHVLNRISYNCKKEEQLKKQREEAAKKLPKEGDADKENTNGGSTNTNTNTNTSDSNTRADDAKANKNGTNAVDDGVNTPRLSQNGKSMNADATTPIDVMDTPALGERDGGSSRSSTPHGAKLVGGRDWDAYSHDSMNPPEDGTGSGGLGGFFNQMGDEPGIVNAADLYKFNQGGLGYGAAMDESKRAELIGNAIKALLEDDDDEE